MLFKKATAKNFDSLKNSPKNSRFNQGHVEDQTPIWGTNKQEHTNFSSNENYYSQQHSRLNSHSPEQNYTKTKSRDNSLSTKQFKKKQNQKIIQNQDYQYSSPQTNNDKGDQQQQSMNKSFDNSGMKKNKQLENSIIKTNQLLNVPKDPRQGERYSPYKKQKEKVKEEVIDKYMGKGKKTYQNNQQMQQNYESSLHPTEMEKSSYGMYENLNKSAISPKKPTYKTSNNSPLNKSVDNMNKLNINITNKNDQSFNSNGGGVNTSRSNKSYHKKNLSYGGNRILQEDEEYDIHEFQENQKRKKRRGSIQSSTSDMTSVSNITGNTSVRRQQMYNRYKKKLAKERQQQMEDYQNSQKQNQVNQPEFYQIYANQPQLYTGLFRPNSQYGLKNLLNVKNFDFENKWYQRVYQRSPQKPQECSRDHFFQNFNTLTNINFQDNQFPANTSILSISKANKPLKNKFARIKEIYDQEQQQKLYLYKYIDPNTISNGEYTNTNYLTSIAALSENPINILNIIENQQISPYGTYYGKICKNGVFRYYYIDDFFPQTLMKIDQKKQQQLNQIKLAFSQNSINFQSNEQEIWVSIIEKLLVKAYGNYQNLQKANVKEILRDLTGSPITELDLNNFTSNQKQIQQIVQKSCEKKYTIVALQRNGNDPNITRFPTSFGMTIVQAQQNQGIHLRNPWGILDKQAPPNYSFETGILKLTWDQLVEMFDTILIVHTQKDAYYINRTIQHNIGAYTISLFEKKIDEEECFLEITQKDQRQFAQLPGIQYEYGEARIILFKTKENYNVFGENDLKYLEDNIDYIDGAYSASEKTTTLNLQNLKAGTYVVISKIEFPTNKHYEFTLSYQGNEKIDFERIEYNSNFHFMGQALVNLCKSQGIKSKETPQKITEYLYLEPKLRLIIQGFECNAQLQEINLDSSFILKRQKRMSARQSIKFTLSKQKDTIFIKDFSKLNKEELKLINIPDFSVQQQERKYYENKDIEAQIKPMHQLQLKPGRSQAIVFSVKNPDYPIDSKSLKNLGFR